MGRLICVITADWRGLSGRLLTFVCPRNVSKFVFVVQENTSHIHYEDQRVVGGFGTSSLFVPETEA
jgi:hypothetical protein